MRRCGITSCRRSWWRRWCGSWSASQERTMSDDRMTPDEARHDEVLRRLQAVHLGYQISREDMATLAREAAAALLALAEDGERMRGRAARHIVDLIRIYEWHTAPSLR